MKYNDNHTEIYCWVIGELRYQVFWNCGEDGREEWYEVRLKRMKYKERPKRLSWFFKDGSKGFQFDSSAAAMKGILDHAHSLYTQEDTHD